MNTIDILSRPGRNLVCRALCVSVSGLLVRATAVLLVVCLHGASRHVASARSHRGIDMCEPIGIPMCTGMPYNMTRMPNHFHHSTQENARLAFKPYVEVIQQNCSADLLFYLCAMFVPICTPQFQKDAIPPCRSVCERSRIGCEPLMNRYNYSWPEDLNCDNLPEYDKGVCVSPEAIVSSMPDDTGTDVNKKAPPVVEKEECKCGKRLKPSKKHFKKGNYDYAIGAIPKHVTPIDANNSVIRVTVKAILKRGSVHLQEDKDMDIWTESSCICPELRMNREYLIISHEEVLLHRLKFNQSSLVSRWNAKWERKLKKWQKRKKGEGGKKKRCKKGDCKSNRRKEKLRCKVDQTDDETKPKVKCTKRRRGQKVKDNITNSSRRRPGGRRRNSSKRKDDIRNKIKT